MVLNCVSTFRGAPNLNEGLVSEKFAQLYTFEKLSIKDFFDELYKIMMERYTRIQVNVP